MIVVSGEIDIDEGDWPVAIQAAIEMMHTSRREDGCIKYDLYAHIDTPGRFHVYEEWESQDALDAHFQTDHMAHWKETLSNINLLRREVKKMEVSSQEEI